VPVRAACLDVTLGFAAAAATFALGIDQPLYFSVHSAARRAGAGRRYTCATRPAADEQDPRSVERELEGLMDLMQPGWRARLSDRRFLPSMVVSHALPLASQGGKRGRPRIDVSQVPGLFVCGDWVGERGFLADTAAASARAAAERCHEALDARTDEAA
jgi:hypothetical protein